MKFTIIKRICAFTLAVCICAAAEVGDGSIKVLAAESVTVKGVADFGRGDSSIQIQGNAEQTLKGKTFRLYQIFHAENAEGKESIRYTFHEPFADVLKKVTAKRLGKNDVKVTEYEVTDYIQSLNRHETEGAATNQNLEGPYSDFRYFVEELRDEIVKDKIAGDTVIVREVKDNNSVEIRGLDYGYYIVDEVTSVGETHSAASLCMVTTLNPAGQISIKSDYPDISKQIQEDDNRKTVGENGWNDVADFETGQKVPYKFTSSVPDMNGYDTYYYAWHDVMDKALTFLPDSVSITISNGTDKDSYTLAESEFTVRMNPGNGETFLVEIEDLKKITDREFPGVDKEGRNQYGQDVVLRYDAVLNDLAAEDTGRPGFENDVKLEFSNNPDGDGRGSTGETPWDTVVCFTYKLNGLKTNNHDRELAGAKFRLYSDENCENEVYVKQTDKGYIVINRDSLGGNDHAGGKRPEEALEIESGENGVFILWGLDGGTYWLKETSAPAGYRPMEDPVRVEVIPSFTDKRDFYVKGDGATEKTLKKLEFAAHIRSFSLGAWKENTVALAADEEDGSGNLTVVNEVGNKLPVTGSAGIPVMIGAGTVLMLIAFRRKRRE